MNTENKPRYKKHWCVTLQMYSGEVEKYSVGIQQAGNARLAGERAIRDEMHSDFGRDGEGGEWTDKDKQSAEDLNGEWIYEVYRCEPLTEEEYNVLRKFI